MMFNRLATSGVTGLLALVLTAGGMCEARAQSSLSADEVIRRAVARARRVELGSGQTAYTYKKLTLTEELDGAGKVKERKERVYQVSFQGGSTQVELIEVNGHPPAATELKKHAEN